MEATTVDTIDIYGGSHWAAAIAWLDVKAGELGPTTTQADVLEGADSWQELCHPSYVRKALAREARLVARQSRRSARQHSPVEPARDRNPKDYGAQVGGKGNERFLRPVVDPRQARTSVPTAERPDRGNVTVRQGPTGLLPCRNVPHAIIATLPVVARKAPDGSDVTAKGTSSRKASAARKRNVARAADPAKAEAARAKAAATRKANRMLAAGRRPIMENGEVIGWEEAS